MRLLANNSGRLYHTKVKKKKYGKLSWVAKQLVCFGVAEFYFAEIRKAF